MGILSMMNMINIVQTCESDCLCFASVFTGLNMQQKSHITKWKEISSGDIKLFITHIIAMGEVTWRNIRARTELFQHHFLGVTCLKTLCNFFWQAFI